MDAPPKGALLLVRFAAAGLLALSGLETGLSVARDIAHHRSVSCLPLALPAILFALAVAILIKSNAIAEWISSWLD